MLEFLIALSLVAHEHHSGQASRWYEIGCLADDYLLRWYQIRSSDDWIEAAYVHAHFKQKVLDIKQQLEHKYFSSRSM
jgi:hypothetical protein